MKPRKHRPAPRVPSLVPTLVAEFHFSPMEHAAFNDLDEDIELDSMLDRLFPDESGTPR
jgi:hypothetical protein